MKLHNHPTVYARAEMRIQMRNRTKFTVATLALLLTTLIVCQSTAELARAVSSNRTGYAPTTATNSMDSSNKSNRVVTAASPTPTPAPCGKIAFVSYRDGTGYPEIYVMDADGSNQTRLTNNTATDDYPEFSKDGSKIVFTSDRDGGGPGIYVMDADGTNQTQLTNNSAGI